MGTYKEHPYYEAQETMLNMLRKEEDPYNELIDTAWRLFRNENGGSPVQSLIHYDFSIVPAAEAVISENISPEEQHEILCDLIPESYQGKWSELMSFPENESYHGIKTTYRNNLWRIAFRALAEDFPSSIELWFNSGRSYLSNLLGWKHKLKSGKAMVIKGWSPTRCQAAMWQDLCLVLKDNMKSASHYIELANNDNTRAAVERMCLILDNIDELLSDEALELLRKDLERRGYDYSLEDIQDMVDDWESYTSMAQSLGSYLFIPSSRFRDRLLIPNSNRIEYAYEQMERTISIGDTSFLGWRTWFDKYERKCFLAPLLNKDGQVREDLLFALSYISPQKGLKPVPPLKCNELLPEKSAFSVCAEWMGLSTDVMFERTVAMRKWALTTERNQITRKNTSAKAESKA